MKGVEVRISGSYDGPMPFGPYYLAKGAYVQGKHIVIVGNLANDSTIRVKYPSSAITVLNFF